MASLKSMATVSGFTAMSRVLGFLRDIFIGYFVGTGLVADAFFAAFRFPNMFRRIFGEGAFNAAFVPLFGRKLESEGKDEAMRFASNAYSTLLWVLGILTVIAIPCMPWIMSLVVPGFKARFSEELSGGAAPVVHEITVMTRGARDVYFQVGAPDGKLTIPSATVGRVRIEEPTLYRRAERSLDDLVGDPLAGATGVRVEEALASGVKLEDLIFQGDAITLAGEGRGSIALPRRHDFIGFRGRLVIEPGPGGDTPAMFKVYRNHPDTFALAVKLSRITFSYLLCMALAAHLSGVLNTFRIFGMPAAAPIILNLVFLAGLGLGWKFGWDPGLVLAWCVAIAGVLQLGALWWTCHRKGAGLRLQLPKFDGEMGRLFSLMGPGVVSASIQQVNLLVGGIIASFQQGAVSFLYYSERVYQLPLGMIGIALGVVLLPDVTRKLRSGRREAAIDSMSGGIELALIITLPAAVALMIIPGPIISVLFERGEFDAESTRQTAGALAGFAFGLPAYVLVKVLQPGYFAREDTRTPMVMAAITVVVNIAVSLLLFPYLKHVGIAIATSVAGVVNVILLAVGLRREGFLSLKRKDQVKLTKVVVASVVMGAAVWLLHSAVRDWFDGDYWRRITALAMLVATGMTVYGALLFGLKATSLAELKANFRSS